MSMSWQEKACREIEEALDAEVNESAKERLFW